MLGKEDLTTPTTHIQVKKSKTQPALPVTELDSKSGERVTTSRRTDGDLTQAGAIMGTPAYMPPEQARGADVDQRADIYSLGAILYEMMTLTPPVGRQGDMLAIMMRVVEGQIDAPAQRAPERVNSGWVSPELSAIALKALAKNRDDRYQSVAHLKRDIELFLEGRSVSAKRDTTWEMFQKLVKRNKGASIMAAGAFVVLAVVAGVFLKINYDARVDAESQRTLAQKTLADFTEEQKEKQRRTREAVPALVAAARQVANTRELPIALEQVELAVLYDPDHADARLLKGQLLLGLKEWTKARAELEQYLAKKPDDADAQELLKWCGAGKASDPVAQFAVAQVLSRQNLPSAAMPLLDDVARVREKRAALVPIYKKQIDAVWPGLGAKLHLLPNTELTLILAGFRQVTILEPLKGMPLASLNLNNTRVVDLTPLQGMPLRSLDLRLTEVADLTPLQGMALTEIHIGSPNLKDITPLQGMPLTMLELIGSEKFNDLTPLKGLPLTKLYLGHFMHLSDLTTFKGMPLTYLWLNNCHKVSDLSPLENMPLTTLHLNYCPVSDLKPLKGMPLTTLLLHSCNSLSDLRPLEGMRLKSLQLNGSRNVNDLTPLKGMPLTKLELAGCLKVTDLTPLEGMKLTAITLEPRLIMKGMDVLRAMKSLVSINDLPPDEFWKKYDAKEFK